jgi:serine/threonine protein phosphatase PrpC
MLSHSLLSTPAPPPPPPPPPPVLRDHPNMVRERELVTVVPEGDTADRDVKRWSSCIAFPAGAHGSDKYREFPIPPQRFQKAKSTICTYGEDTASYQEEDLEDGGSIFFASSNDGHGGSSVVSRDCTYKFAEDRAQDVEGLVRDMKARNADSLFQRDQVLVSEMEASSKKYTLGGTTLYLSSIHTSVEGDVTVFTTNLGDSGGFFICLDTGRIIMCYTAHNWDDIDEYQTYLDYCIERGIEPMVPIYARFNLKDAFGNFKGHKVPNWNGRLETYLLYKEKEDGTVEIDERNRKYVWRKIREMHPDASLGGIQSESHRYIQQRQEPDGSWVDHAHHPDHAHKNWGATGIVPGGSESIQMTRTVGDHTFPTMKKGSQRFFTVPKDWKNFVYVQGSDGWLDAKPPVVYGDLVREFVDRTPDATGQDIAYFLYMSITTGEMLSYSMKHGKPSWDDVHVVAKRWKRS